MTQSLDLDPGKTDRDRPERPENDEQSIDCVTQTRATSFTADPSVVKPDTGGATIRWEVEAPPGCPVRIMLNGRSVRHSGTLSVRPAVTTRYTLTAHAGDHGRGLGSRRSRSTRGGSTWPCGSVWPSTTSSIPT